MLVFANIDLFSMVCNAVDTYIRAVLNSFKAFLIMLTFEINMSMLQWSFSFRLH